MPLRDLEPALRWTPADRLHLTVKFLGACAPDQIAVIGAALRDVARNHAGVPLVVRGAGAFPTLRRPRVVWAGVEPSPRLELLQHDVETALAAAGFPLEGRAFRPHVTLARVPAPLPPERARSLARLLRQFTWDHEGAVSSLDLMQSSLTQDAPRYRCLDSVPLRAG